MNTETTKLATTIGESILSTPVHVTAQGESRVANAATFHPDTIAAIWTYGVRRWFQDSINSQAATNRNAIAEAVAKGEKPPADFDVPAAFDARMAQAESGEVSARGESVTFTDLENAMYDAAKSVRNESAWSVIGAAFKASTKAKETTNERKARILATIAAMPEPARVALESAAKAALATKAALAGLSLDDANGETSNPVS